MPQMPHMPQLPARLPTRRASRKRRILYINMSAAEYEQKNAFVSTGQSMD
jgi:hypothetical protein